MNIYENISKVIGNTPLIKLDNFKKEYSFDCNLFAKCEFFNPTGSAKDRAAKYMVDDAVAKGIIKAGATIIEPTSGNTGIGLAAYAVPKGFKVIIVMPDTMSEERISLIKAYGAEVILTDGKLGMAGAIAEAERIRAITENSFIPDQFCNPANARAHYETTGPEIWDDTNGKIDIFVAGVGTGGTITGVGRYLKEKNPNIKIIAVEPQKSPVLSGGKANPHGLQGIGANFIPQVLDFSVIDEIIAVSDESAFKLTRELSVREGIFAGISSGAAMVAALELTKRIENKDTNIIVLLPDSGTRYISTGIFNKR